MVSRPGGATGGQPVTYRIDREDRLIEVCENWRAFALENGGPMPHVDPLLGHTLWNFIADPATVHLYQLMVARIRGGGAAVRFQFRCDSPERRRLMSMEMFGEEEGSVTFRATPIYEEARSRVPAPARLAGAPLLPVCGWCSRFRLADDEWVEPEAAVAALGIFQSSSVPEVTHGMCPDCYVAIMKALDLSAEAPDPVP
ncbi:MAG: hypothetical protein ABIX28_00805 [Vicinamibacterales bacterium]